MEALVKQRQIEIESSIQVILISFLVTVSLTRGDPSLYLTVPETQVLSTQLDSRNYYGEKSFQTLCDFRSVVLLVI